jgi:hypothetical protein
VKRIIIRCPSCDSQRSELVADDLIDLRKSIDKGMVLLGVSKGKICGHTFYLEIDKNFSIRNIYTSEDLLNFKEKDLRHIISL